MMSVPWLYRASYVRVVDGDNVVLRIDEGFRNETVQSIRLVGVNAPELFSGTNREQGAVAKAECMEWLFGHIDIRVTWPLVVETLKDKQTLGRYLGTIYDLEGNSLNEYLISRPWQEDSP